MALARLALYSLTARTLFLCGFVPGVRTKTASAAVAKAETVRSAVPCVGFQRVVGTQLGQGHSYCADIVVTATSKVTEIVH